jgi:hypothetical protein
VIARGGTQLWIRACNFCHGSWEEPKIIRETVELKAGTRYLPFGVIRHQISHR